MGIFSKWVESLDYEYEILSICSRHKSPRSTCNSCVDVCESDAIVLKKRVPVIQHTKCNECGKCIASCPVQAVAGIFPKRTFIQNKLIAENNSVPSVKELLVYAKKGIKGIVTEGDLSDKWRQTIEEANEIIKVLNETPLIIQEKKGEQVNETYTRRELFFSWKQETQILMKEMAPAKWRFNQKDLELSKYYLNHQFAEIHLDVSKCTLCKACQKLCNNKCLNISDGGFEISTQACSSCRLCEDICPEKAIYVIEKVSLHKEVRHNSYTNECITCGQPFETLSESNDECVPCKKKARFIISC